MTNLMNRLNKPIDILNKENKYCVILGDFNIHLLKCESHRDTDTFLYSLLSSPLPPHILQPTRITDPSSATLTDFFVIHFKIIF